MTTYRFEQVKLPASKSFACVDCGKKTRRQKTFMETLNPFNRNADGSVKDRAEIYESLRAKVAAWKEAPGRCTPCDDAAWEAERAGRAATS